MIKKPQKEVSSVSPANAAEWRKWLQKNHKDQYSIWLIMFKKSSAAHNLTWSESVDEALCFGWIDSLKKTIDEERSMQLFSQRKSNSTWSKINKEKVNHLIESGRMMPAGYRSIEIAQKNGSWTILDSVEALTIPKDLMQAFRKIKGSKSYFMSLSKSAKKGLLQWIVMAKRPETREKRISAIAENAGRQELPPAFR